MDQSRITDAKKDTVTGLNPVKGVERNSEIYKLDETVIVIESLTIVKMIVLFNKVLFPWSKFSF